MKDMNKLITSQTEVNNNIKLIRDLMKDEDIDDGIEMPWIGEDNIFEIRAVVDEEGINTTKLIEHFNIIHIAVDADHEMSIFVEPKKVN